MSDVRCPKPEVARSEPFDVPRAVSGSAEQFGPELTAEGLTVEAPVEPSSVNGRRSSSGMAWVHLTASPMAG